MIRAEREVGEWRSSYPIALRLERGRWKLVKPAYVVVSGWVTPPDIYESWYYPDDIHVLLYLERGITGRDVLLTKCFLDEYICSKLKKWVKEVWEKANDEKEVERMFA